jgi:hypothetical protein
MFILLFFLLWRRLVFYTVNMLPTSSWRASCTLKIQEECSSEMLATVHETTRFYIPEESTIHSRSFIHLFIHPSMVLQPFLAPLPLLQFRNIFYTDGRTPWTGDQPVARPLPTHSRTQAQDKRTETSMPWMGFETTIPAFERGKTVNALERIIHNHHHNNPGYTY